MYGGGEDSAGIFLHRSGDDAIVKGGGTELKDDISRTATCDALQEVL